MTDKNKRVVNTSILFLLLCVMGLQAACTPPAWFVTAENIAKATVPIAGTLITVVDPALAPAVALAETGFSALTKTLDSYKVSPTATNLQQVQAAFEALDANVANLESAARIKNPVTDAKIAAIIQLLGQAVAEIAAQVPPPTTGVRLSARLKVSAQPKGLTAKDITKQYNQIVAGDSRFKKL